jgi:hypothetical protein
VAGAILPGQAGAPAGVVREGDNVEDVEDASGHGEGAGVGLAIGDVGRDEGVGEADQEEQAGNRHRHTAGRGKFFSSVY